MNKNGFLTKEEFHNYGNSYHSYYLNYQNTFIKKFKKNFPQEYLRKWPLDKLSWWSRPFEYHFVNQEINNIYNLKLKNKFKILEIGPGCSFFTYELCNNRYVDKYHIIDIDSEVNNFWETITKKIKPKEFKDLKNDYYDIIISISVFEHIDNKAQVFEHLIKSLKKGGSLLLTLDYDFNYNTEFGLSDKELNEMISHKKLTVDSGSNIKQTFKPLIGYRAFPFKTDFKSKIKRFAKKLLNYKKPNYNIGLYRFKSIKN